ncbi:glycosyltransferase family 4 protein [Stieleria sp. TO1_6]|uniref:glycosyltransferase family 4 protein n=1 Tax=Stieleria tagensis TaxID=2956795 RepID=UPI00209AC046|nr:glycosyltransferase family 4 protein [Stieleria tagensis]MCO8123824.1 glycosyltransferase family 4 protein [Stieleria tagensis]
MRIAHIITRMIIGGAQENTLLNCLDLIEHYGDDVMLITGPALGPEGDLLQRSGFETSAANDPGRNDRGRAGELNIQLLPSLRRNIQPATDWNAARAIRRTLRQFRPDVVHTHSAKAGLIGRKVAWSLGVPAVLHSVHGAPFHAFQSPLARETFRRCERYAAQRCHHMISVADAMTDLMVDAGVAPRDKFTTVYSGMDVEPFLAADQHRERIRARYNIAADRVVIGKIARLFHLKGHDDLIDVAAQVVRECPQVLFLLVGDGILREPLKQRIESLGLSDHFVFTGLVSPTEVPALIGAMDALVHTSLREGLARALPQALIAGKPAISYDVDGAREVVINDQTGFLVAPRDRSGLAEALIRVAENQPLRAKLGGEGRLRFTDQFRHQTMTRRIRQIYETIASR